MIFKFPSDPNRIRFILHLTMTRRDRWNRGFLPSWLFCPVKGGLCPCTPLSLERVRVQGNQTSSLAGAAALPGSRASALSEPWLRAWPCFLPALLKCFPLSRLFHVLFSAFFNVLWHTVLWQRPGSTIPLPWRNSHQDKRSVGGVCSLMQRCAHTGQLLPFSWHLLSGTVDVNVLKAILYPAASGSTGSTSTHFPPTARGTGSHKC